MRKLPAIVSAVVIAGLVGVPEAAAQPVEAPAEPTSSQRPYVKPAPVSFVRIRNDDAGQPAALQVAIVRYAPMDGSTLSVTLYGAVHVGDAAYYERLNQSFKRHDALLYELANDPQVLRERDRAPRSLFSMLQMDLGARLGLTKQLEAVDYDRPNFVHADIPMLELVDHAQAQGDDMLTVTTQTLLDIQRMINRGEDPMSALMAPGDGREGPPTTDPFGGPLGFAGDSRQMKIQVAEQLASQSQGGILEGITVLDRYLIGARNQRCVDVMEQQIGAGKDDIGIFYGAGHNPDFHRRLMVDYGLKPADVTWVDAWDLKSRATPRQNKAREMSEEELLMELMRRLLESEP